MSNKEYTNLLALFGIGGAHPGGLELTKELLLNKNLKESTFLEVGCGTGQTSAFLHSLGVQLSTIDSHPVMVEKANSRFSRENISCTAYEMSIENTSFPDNHFDYCLAESVLSFTNISKTIPEIVRILKNDGSLLAMEMTKKNTLPLHLEQRIIDFYGLTSILSTTDWENACFASGFYEVFVTPLSLNDIPSTEPDIDPSINIENKYFDIMQEHEELTILSRQHLEVSIITAVKKTANAAI